MKPGDREESKKGVTRRKEHTGVLGASGKDVWTFEALKEGTTEISMDYSRPWEKGEKAEWAFVAPITVE